MQEVFIHEKKFVPSIGYDLIQAEIKNLASVLNQKYKDLGETPLIIGILNGSFMFVADLIREIDFYPTIQFIRIESYQGLQTTGVVKMESELSYKWVDKHVIVLEDIIDTGHTMARFIPVLKSYNPKSVFVASLLFKEEALEVPVQLDHFCFKIPQKFVIGYGLDYDGLGRNLKDIYELKSV